MVTPPRASKREGLLRKCSRQPRMLVGSRSVCPGLWIKERGVSVCNEVVETHGFSVRAE